MPLDADSLVISHDERASPASASSDRRAAVRALGSLGMAVLATLGLAAATPDASAKKSRH